MHSSPLDHARVDHALVTGATGFIGQRLVARLTAQGCKVTCVVRSGSKTQTLTQMGAQLVNGDVTHAASLGEVLEASQPTIVYHLAGVVKAIRNADFTQVNVLGSATLAEACARLKTPPVLVVVSSLAASGPGLETRETKAPQPVSAYGASKLEGERAVGQWASHVPITIIRPPIVFGPGDRGVLEMFRAIHRTKMHLVPGYRDSRFSLVHVDGLVEGLILAAHKGERLSGEAGPLGQGVYYIANDETPTYAELGRAIAQGLGVETLRLIRMPGWCLKIAGVCGDLAGRISGNAPWINSDKMREATAGDWTCDASKAREQLGWKSAGSLQEGLDETALWYRNNRWL